MSVLFLLASESNPDLIGVITETIAVAVKTILLFVGFVALIIVVGLLGWIPTTIYGVVWLIVGCVSLVDTIQGDSYSEQMLSYWDASPWAILYGLVTIMIGIAWTGFAYDGLDLD